MPMIRRHLLLVAFAVAPFLTTLGVAQSNLDIGLSVGGAPFIGVENVLLPEASLHVVTRPEDGDMRVRFSVTSVAILFNSFGVAALFPFGGEEDVATPYAGVGVSASALPLSIFGRGIAGVEFQELGIVRPFVEVDAGVGYIQDMPGVQIVPSVRAGFLIRLP